EVVDALAFDDGRGPDAVALAEARRVPEFEVVVLAGDDDVAVERGVLPQRLRDGDAALLVGCDVDRTREERADRLPLDGAAAADVLQPARPLPELGDGEHGEAAVERLRHDRTPLELVAKARREDDSPLRVEGVLVLSQEHRPRSTCLGPLGPARSRV